MTHVMVLLTFRKQAGRGALGVCDFLLEIASPDEDKTTRWRMGGWWSREWDFHDSGEKVGDRKSVESSRRIRLGGKTRGERRSGRAEELAKIMEGNWSMARENSANGGGGGLNWLARGRALDVEGGKSITDLSGSRPARGLQFRNPSSRNSSFRDLNRQRWGVSGVVLGGFR